VAWQPGKLGKNLRMDGPMALWFAEIRGRQVIMPSSGKQQNFVNNRYLSPNARARRLITPLHRAG
jgi:hypothetical protein